MPKLAIFDRQKTQGGSCFIAEYLWLIAYYLVILLSMLSRCQFWWFNKESAFASPAEPAQSLVCSFAGSFCLAIMGQASCWREVQASLNRGQQQLARAGALGNCHNMLHRRLLLRADTGASTKTPGMNRPSRLEIASGCVGTRRFNVFRFWYQIPSLSNVAE